MFLKIGLICFYYITGQYSSLVKTVETMSVIFIKLAQWLAERPDFLNPKLITELKTLQNKCTVHPISESKFILLNDGVYYKLKLHELIGSGSIAQVYRCTYRDKECAIKIRHPNIDDQLSRDSKTILNIFEGIKYMRKYTLLRPLVNKCIIDMDYILEEIEKQCNLHTEAENIIAYSKNILGCPYIKVPNVYYSSRDVLIIDYFKGKNIDEYLGEESCYNKISLRLLAHYYKSILNDGIVHGDIHSKNIIIDRDENICLIDFGLVVENKKKIMLSFFMNHNNITRILPLVSINYKEGDVIVYPFENIQSGLAYDFKNNLMKFLYKNGIVLRSDFILMLNNLDTVLQYNKKDYRQDLKEMIQDDPYFSKHLTYFLLFI